MPCKTKGRSENKGASTGRVPLVARLRESSPSWRFWFRSPPEWQRRPMGAMKELPSTYLQWASNGSTTFALTYPMSKNAMPLCVLFGQRSAAQDEEHSRYRDVNIVEGRS